MNILTNEWTNADLANPPKDRVVLVRVSSTGEYRLAAWNGMYYVNYPECCRIAKTDKVTHWYIFERFFERDAV